MTTLKKICCVFALTGAMAFESHGTGLALNDFSIDIGGNTTTSLTVSSEAAEAPVSGVQFDIVLPQYITLESVMAGSACPDFKVEYQKFESGTVRVVAYSDASSAISSGEVLALTFGCSAQAQPGVATITLLKALCSSNDGRDIACDDISALISVNPVTEQNITLSANDMTLLVGQTGQLFATVEGDNTAETVVTWKSDDESIATVSADGAVSALAEGVANISAVYGEASATCKVVVVTLTADDVDVAPGEGTTEGDAEDPEGSGSLTGSDLTLRIEHTAEIVLSVMYELTVCPKFVWELGDNASQYVSMIVGDDTSTAAFTGIAIGETYYTVRLNGESEVLASGKITVLKQYNSVENVACEGNSQLVRVYNLQGMRLPVDSRDELKGLPPGVYIVNGDKEFVN